MTLAADNTRHAAQASHAPLDDGRRPDARLELGATARIAQFVAALDARSIPKAALEKARTCVLYGFGIGLMCLRESVSRLAEDALVALDGERLGSRGATSLLSGRRLSVSAAAFSNAVLLHTRCQEDTSGTAHLGVVVLSVVMALAEAGLARPEDVRPAIVAGYEVAGLLERQLGKQTMVAGFRASSVYGGFAAAAAAARALALPEGQIGAALANAASFAGGTLQSIAEGTDEWRFQVGTAARSGLVAAMLASRGSVSSVHGIEGNNGFCTAFARVDGRAADWSADLGRIWSILKVTFKPYPVCAHNQAVVELAVDIGAEIDADAIDRVMLTLNPYVVPGLLNRGPFSRVSETLLSTCFCAAVGILRGAVTPYDLQDVNDARIAALIGRMTIELDSKIEFPSARADLVLRDGRTLHFVKQRVFEDYSFARPEVVLQLARLATESAVPQVALDRLAQAIADERGVSFEAVADAYTLAREPAATQAAR